MAAAKSSRAPGGSADPRIHLNDQICQKVVHMYMSDPAAPAPVDVKTPSKTPMTPTSSQTSPMSALKLPKTPILNSAQVVKDVLGNLKKTSRPAALPLIEERIEKMATLCRNIPRSKIMVMFIGNHSAGKSSFINYYVGETDLLKENIAMETAEVTFISQGKSRVEWQPEATKRHYPFLQIAQSDLSSSRAQEYRDLQVCFDKHVRTIVSTSQERLFPFIDLVDTPGMHDGKTLTLEYDVGKTIKYLADFADLVIVFLDPDKQALVKSTMECVGSLQEKNCQKMHYFITRADTLNSADDRVRIVQQASSEITKIVKDTHRLKLFTMYIPGKTEAASKDRDNQIHELIDIMHKKAEAHVQDILCQLENDSKEVEAECLRILEDHKPSLMRKSKRFAANSFAGLMLILFLLFRVANVLLFFDLTSTDCSPTNLLCVLLKVQSKISWTVEATMWLCFLVPFMWYRFTTASRQSVSKKEAADLEAIISDMHVVKQAKDRLMDMFMQQSKDEAKRIVHED
jgi:GTPase Era involved in 16S rRNA processing